MFTGIIDEIGQVLSLTPGPSDAADARIEISGPRVTSDVALGDSISVSGVCLTVTSFAHGAFTADIMPETMRHTTLGNLKPGASVNLERAVAVGDRLGGHIVQGHVDTITQLRSRVAGERWDELTFALPEQIAPLVAHKGSITIDGVSLTVSAVDVETVTVSLIPATLRETTLGEKQVGDWVNIETDVIAKHLARLAQWEK